jgi:hypothetical protein
MVVEWTGPIVPVKKQPHIHPKQYRLFARVRSFLLRIWRHIDGFFSRREL